MNQKSSHGRRTKHTALPIDQHRRQLLYLLEKHQVLVVAGETGSGKSTRIPQILLNSGAHNGPDGDKIICITQPRRVAALQLAQRVSDELQCELGTTVGYSIRFQNATSQQTAIKFVTEGLLLRELMIDPILERYSVIMVDEVHERNLNTDILLGLLKCIILRRRDLRVLVCSATLDQEEFVRFFTFTLRDEHSTKVEPAALHITGTTYPIKIYHRTAAVANYLDATVETVINIHETNRLATGKVLAFLTGQDEVDYVCQKLQDYAQVARSQMHLKKLVVLPLYASLKAAEVSKVFAEHGSNSRICIISTNVAETSLTIDNVAFVVDCGYTKVKVYNYLRGSDSLVRVPISKGSARQRAGRAGRTRDGSVYRLYSLDEYEKLAESSVPELQRCSLAEVVMLLKSLGVEDLERFPLMSPMPRQNLIAALELLNALGTITDEGQLTRSGELMSRLNLDPKLAKALVHPGSASCAAEICKIIGVLQVKEIYSKQAPGGRWGASLWSNQQLVGLCSAEGDLLSYLNLMNAFVASNKSPKWAEKRNLNHGALSNALEISGRLEGQLRQFGLSVGSSQAGGAQVDSIQRSLVAGLFANGAYLHSDGDYRTIRGDQTVHVHANSVFSEVVERPKYVIFAELLHTTKPFMRHLIAVERQWLLSAAPNFYTFTTSRELAQKSHE